MDKLFIRLGLVAIGIGIAFSIGIVVILWTKSSSETGPASTAQTYTETYLALRDMVIDGRLNQSLTPKNFTTFALNHLPIDTPCPNDAIEEKCWDFSSQGKGGSEVSQPGAILTNGATLIGLDNGVQLSQSVWCNGIWIDTNGPKGPNQYGKDQFNIILSYGEKTGQDWCKGVRPGQLLVKPESIRNQIENTLKVSS